MRKTVLIALALSLILVLTLSSAIFANSPSLTNPGFEAGDLSGWTLTVPAFGSAAAVTNYTADFGGGPDYYAPDGSYFALLKTGLADIYSSISQSFSANAGDTISGWAFFDAWEELFFNDDCKVEIKDSVDSVIATLFSKSASSVGWRGETPWTFWSYTFTVAGTYKLQAGVANDQDPSVDSYLGLDLVMDTTAPVVTLEFPTANLAVQDGVTLQASASDLSGVAAVSFHIREPDGAQGKIIGPGFEDLPATFDAATGRWEYNFDTLQLPDGDYLVIARAVDTYNNEGWSTALPFSIENADTDGDGMNNNEEVAGWDITIYDCLRAPTASVHVTSDPSQADTDGDGLNDLQEKQGWDVQYIVQNSSPPPAGLTIQYHVSSDPRSPDVDNDGVNDQQEMASQTDPNRADTDCDSAWDTNDGFEIAYGLDPVNYDTNGNGVPDGAEIDQWVEAGGYDPSQPELVPPEVVLWAVAGASDGAPPDVAIEFPTENITVQDGIAPEASASDPSGVSAVHFYVREPDGAQGKIISAEFENLPATFNSGTGKWESNFDTLQLPDGYYLVLANAVDTYNNEGLSAAVPFSIRNWAVIHLLPSTPNGKAGRTMPVKFALRVAASVDPAQPFVWNDDLTIKIYATSNPGVILQTSTFGNGARNYRIQDNTLYITNFQTSKVPMQYTVEIWRTGKNWLVGSFTFKTVK